MATSLRWKISSSAGVCYNAAACSENRALLARNPIAGTGPEANAEGCLVAPSRQILYCFSRKAENREMDALLVPIFTTIDS